MRYIQTKTETNRNRINQKSYLTKFSGFTTIRNMMFVRTGRMLCITYICNNIEFTVLGASFYVEFQYEFQK
mgnify:CR=1 FL=1